MRAAAGALRAGAVALLLLAGCGRQQAAAPASVPAGNAAWGRFVDGYVEESFRAQPMFAVQSGRHEFDGRMPDWSRAGIAAEIRRLQAVHAAALAFAPASLDESQRFERDYLLAEIGGELFWLDPAAAPFRNPAWYVNQLDPEVYLSREYAPLERRLSGYIGYAQAIPGVVADIEANLRTPLPRSFVEYAINAFGGFADFYGRDVPAVFATVGDAAARQQLASANAAAVKAMRELRDWFVMQRAGANDDYALGAGLFAAMLRETDSVDMPVAAIKAAGEADAARNSAALKSACAAYAPGASISACVVRTTLRKPPGGPVAAARAELDSLRNFVREQDLVSIPSAQQALVQESPPYNRGNSAYITVPGFYDSNVASVFNITPPDPRWSKAEQQQYIQGIAGTRDTTIHEVWPGHFLQFQHSNRAASIIGRLYVGYDFAEGWAHYAEELMQEAGFRADDAEMHIAQLTDALWRDARLLSAIGLHTGGMTVADSEKLFRELAFTDPGTARQQAARGTYDPAYLNYTLGKLQIRKLRADWIATQMAGRGDAQPRQFWKAFHDRFLSYGGPPIPLVRRAMLPDDHGPLL